MIYSGVMEKQSTFFKQIKTNHLIVLCEINEDYKSFYDDLEKLIKSNKNKNLVKKVYHIIQGDIPFYSSKYKNFITKHKRTIEIMNKYSCLSNLTVLSYDEKGNRIKNLTEDYFYHYIQEHKINIAIIKNVALKIKDLGVDEIYFSEKLDFTKFEYELDFDAILCNFTFLENMEIDPTYLNSPIKYKTNNSCFCLHLDFNNYGLNKEIRKWNRTIELNNLIFDPSKLPNEITIASTIDVIKDLAEKKKIERKSIQNALDLNIATSDLINYFKCLKNISKKIDNIKNNQELADLLNNLQKILSQLQIFGINYENHIIDSHLAITDEIMKREKKLYLNRRAWSNIDLD